MTWPNNVVRSLRGCEFFRSGGASAADCFVNCRNFRRRLRRRYYPARNHVGK